VTTSLRPVRSYPRSRPEPRTYITARQREILLLVANGSTNQSTARKLGLSVETIKSQMQLILRKLRVGDRAQAVAVGLRIGVLRLDEITVPKDANRGYRDPA